MHTQPQIQFQPNRSAIKRNANAEKFTIFHGKASAKFSPDGETTLLPIQYVVFDTLVTGIRSAIQNRDFKGAILIDYDLNGEEYHIVFAMWYSKNDRIYFLSSLGQYSTREFHRGMRRFKRANEYSLKIKLAPIHREALTDLQEKLARSNLSGANVCLIDDTIQPEI